MSFYSQTEHPFITQCKTTNFIAANIQYVEWRFLDAFTKLRKASTKLRHVRLFRMEQLGSHWMDFHEIWYW